MVVSVSANTTPTYADERLSVTALPLGQTSLWLSALVLSVEVVIDISFRISMTTDNTALLWPS